MSSSKRIRFVFTNSSSSSFSSSNTVTSPRQTSYLSHDAAIHTMLNPTVLPTTKAGWRRLGEIRADILFYEICAVDIAFIDEAVEKWGSERWPRLLGGLSLWIISVLTSLSLPIPQPTSDGALNPLSNTETTSESPSRVRERQAYDNLHALLSDEFKNKIDDGSVGGDLSYRIAWLGWGYVRRLLGDPMDGL